MKRTVLALAAGLAGLLAPAAAQAGTFTVHACGDAGANWANRSWVGQTLPGLGVDTVCDQPGSHIGTRVTAGLTVASGQAAALTVTTPPGTTITDFALNRVLDYPAGAPAGRHQLYALYRLGGIVFAGAGDYDDATRARLNAQKQWYGYPAATVKVRGIASLRSYPALAGYRGTASSLSLVVGCFPRGGTACSVPAGATLQHLIAGSSLTVSDPVAPSEVSPEASGLLAGGPRQGSDPVTVSATDNTGIRRLELIDVTNPAAPQLVGAADQGCSYRLLHPCPNLDRALLFPTSLQAGRRTVIVRAIDAGSNVVDRGPYTVDAVTPSNRGAGNGSSATDGGKIVVSFARGPKTRQTAGYGRRVKIGGRLYDLNGQVVSGARLDVLTKDLREGAQPVVRGTVTTAADGSFSYRARASASRLIQFAWRSHVNDVRAVANGYVKLFARAAARLRAPRGTRVGRRLTLSGTLRGVARGGVTVVLQGRGPGGRYQTFADGTSSATGRFSVHYRFRTAASRGRTFSFRAKIKPSARYPYVQGYSNTVRVRVR